MSSKTAGADVLISLMVLPLKCREPAQMALPESVRWFGTLFPSQNANDD